MTRSERDQIRRFQEGGAEGFDAFYHAFSDRLYHFCYRLCGHPADAEDLAQDVFVAAYQGLSGFAARSSLATWLFRIAYYRWKRLHAASRPVTVPLDEDSMDATTPDATSARLERLSLDSALASLPEPLREAFLLIKEEGLRYREAAEVLGVPQGTIQWRVHEAVVRLRALLSEPAENEPIRR